MVIRKCENFCFKQVTHTEKNVTVKTFFLIVYEKFRLSHLRYNFMTYLNTKLTFDSIVAIAKIDMIFIGVE